MFVLDFQERHETLKLQQKKRPNSQLSNRFDSKLVSKRDKIYIRDVGIQLEQEDEDYVDRMDLEERILSECNKTRRILDRKY